MSSVPSRLRVGLAWTVPAVCVTLLVVFALLSYGSPAWGTEINSAALELIPLSIGFSCLGALIVAHRRGNRLGWLYLFIGTASAFTLFCFMYAQHGLIDAPGSLPAAVFAGWVSGWVWAVGGVSAFSVGLLWFPDGRLLSPRWRWAVGAAVASIVLLVASQALLPGPPPNHHVSDNPVGLSGAEPVLAVLAGAGMVLLVLAFASGLASLALRWRRAGPGSPGRRQVGLLFAASALLVVAFALEAPPPQPWWQIVVAMVIVAFGPAAIGMAILRHGLYDIDVVVNRSLVYGLLTGLVIGVYGGTVWITGRFVDDVGSPAVTAVATGVVAAVLLPLRAGLQRIVDRLMYGDRGDPWKAVSRLASQLERVTAPGSTTDGVVSAIASSLRLPYVAVRTSAGVVAETGSPGTRPLSEFPLSAAGEPVGVLVVAGRDRRQLGTRDRTVLVELARHAGAAVQAAQLADALHASREQLVTTREEERRRLRRDLHDGLGPTLAGMALGLEVLDGLLVTDPCSAKLLIADLKAEATNSVTDVRRVVYGLRPPALDEFGLVRAIAARIDRVRSGYPELVIRFDAPGQLPALSAAAEVAAYRIAVEALSNVALHARAHRCDLRILIAPGEELQIEGSDDGTGLNGSPPGVGLTGMRERAAELGGRCTVSANPSGGVRVLAALPLRSAP